jgi:predicted metal-dependent phosphoesterase TrpH
MLKFMRNKLVSIEKTDQETLLAYGVLDDDIYSLRIRVSVGISDLEIKSIEGTWSRWTTPECPRAIPFLQEAVGFIIEDGITEKVRNTVARKACRHFGNLLLECCQSAREAVQLIKGQDERSIEESDIQRDQTADDVAEERALGGMIIDLHVHTSPASPCSSAPVDQLIEEAKSIGLDGICLTDHNYVWEPGKVKDLSQRHGFFVLAGNEITTNQGDMIVFGLSRDIKGIIRLEELREEVLKADGFIIVAHPFRGFLTFGVGETGLTPEKAMERPLFQYVDAIEVMNGKVTEKENAFASRVATGLGLPSTGGSDAHEVHEVGVYATQFATAIRDEKELIEALRGGDYAPIAFRKEKRARRASS